MSDRETAENRRDACEGETPHESELVELADRSAPIETLADRLVDGAIRAAAADTGRTPEEQLDRMGDHFAFQATEQDPHQKQLADYELSGEVVDAER